MKIAAVVVFAWFILFSLLHLVFCYLELEKLRKYTKPFCVGLLGVAAVLYAPTEPFVYVGCACGVVGDILLLRKDDTPYFVAGTGVFFLGHVFYMLAIFKQIPFYLTWWAYAVPFCIVFYLTFFLFPFTRRVADTLSLVGNAYMPMLLINMSLAIVVMMNVPSKVPALLVMLGYILFFISDSLIVVDKFVKYIKKPHFFIMLTYLVAQGLIVAGLVVGLAGISF